MFESILNFFKKMGKTEKEQMSSKQAAKERLHLVLMQDRANVSADFLDLMKQEIIDVIKKYIDVDENAIDVRLTNKSNHDGTTGAPALYANIPIVSIKEDVKNGMARQKIQKEQPETSIAESKEEDKKEIKQDNKKEVSKQQPSEQNKEKNKEELEMILEEKQEEIKQTKETPQTEKKKETQKEDTKKEATKK